jgi:hypothetical protein
LIRLAGLGPQEKAALVARVFQTRGNELTDAFAVITRSTVRVRR